MRSRLPFLFAVLIFVPSLAFAQGLVPLCGYDLDDDGVYKSATEGCKLCHFLVLINNVLSFIFTKFLPAVAVLMVIIGGVMFLTSGGNPGQLQQGREVLRTTAIGLFIAYAAWLAVDLFFVAMGLAEWTGLTKGWFAIECPL